MNQPLEKLRDWMDDAESESVAPCDSLEQESYQEAAELLLIHGLLSDFGHRYAERDSARIKALMKSIDLEQQPTTPSVPANSSQKNSSRRIAFLSSALSLAAVLVVMFVLLGPQQNVSAAMASLEKVLAAAAHPRDRTYKIRVVEEYPRDKRPRKLPQQVQQRDAEEQLEGATLYLRGADRYVLVRLLPDGRRRISGCDGEQSWAFREDGPVHVSADASRFRGGLPGHQQDIPFINIHSHLSQLQSGYKIELTSARQEATDGTVLSQLLGIRKSREIRGPKQVEIWFNSDNGTVHTMLLVGLPRGRGGPKSVSLELINQTDLGPDFFSHQSHHQPDRTIRQEEPQN